MKINVEANAPDFVATIIRRKLLEKCEPDSLPGCSLTLRLDAGRPGESYRISGGPDYTIAGASLTGLLAGAGRFVRGCAPGCRSGRPDPYDGWTGEDSPEMPYRVVYFPMHFFNFYHAAPIEAVFIYLEDLALMGYNAILMWYDMHHFTAVDTPESAAMIARMQAIFQKAATLGMANMLLGLSNEAFAASPRNLRARSSGGHDGYRYNLAGHYHVELCPSQAGAMELLLAWRRQVLEQFRDCSIKVFCISPYDQGGCTCGACKPWGVNGNIRIAEKIAGLVREILPDAQLMFSTWRFDHFTDGEWDELGRMLAEKQPYADLLFSELQEPGVYRYFTERSIPGGLPVIGFPEISMIGAVPWGGFGANPHPSVIRRNWDTARRYVSGGAPYSEGIYEDINKFIYAQLYWSPDRDIGDIVRDYIRSEFSADPDVLEDIANLIGLFEETLNRHRVDERGTIHDYPDDNIPRYGLQRFVISNPGPIEPAYRLMSRIDARLPERTRKGWRWRLFYLRAAIDQALAAHDFLCNEQTDRYMEELTRYYYAQDADYACSPPTRAVIETKSAGTTFITFDEEEQAGAGA